MSKKKRNKRKDTKIYAIRMEKRKNNKLWRELKEKIRKRDNGCIICGDATLTHTHHLIPREIKEHKFEILNLVSLCPKHHKYSFQISAHRNSLAFYYWLSVNRPAQFEFVKNIISNSLLHSNEIINPLTNT